MSYPLLRAVAAWWSCWLVKQPKEDGGYTYNDLTDCTYEGCMWCGTWGNKSGCFNRNDVNSAVALSFSRLILQHLVSVSDEGLVKPPPAELASWRDILQNLSPLPRGWVRCHDNGGRSSDPPHAPFSRNFTRPCESTNATAPSVVGSNYTVEVFLPQESPFFFTTRYNPLEFYGIWPGEGVGLGSDPHLLAVAQNSVTYGDAYAQNNAFPEVRQPVRATIQ